MHPLTDAPLRGHHPRPVALREADRRTRLGVKGHQGVGAAPPRSFYLTLLRMVDRHEPASGYEHERIFLREPGVCRRALGRLAVERERLQAQRLEGAGFELHLARGRAEAEALIAPVLPPPEKAVSLEEFTEGEAHGGEPVVPDLLNRLPGPLLLLPEPEREPPPELVVIPPFMKGPDAPGAGKAEDRGEPEL